MEHNSSIYSVLTHTLNPQMESKGQHIFWLKVVMLHIKLKGIEHSVSCNYIFFSYTHHRPPYGVKTFFFAESSHVAYRIKGNGTQSTMQAHILFIHTHPRPLNGVKRSNIFAESSHVAYQSKQNGTQITMQKHILS